MAAYDILFRDPGGEYYFSLGMTASGIWTFGNGGSCVNNAPSGRATTYAINSGGFGKNFPNFQNWIVGSATYINTSIFSSGGIFLQLLDNNTEQISIRSLSTGALQITRNGTVLGTTTNLLSTNTWYYIELKATIASGTSGSAELRVNGVIWLTINSVNTQATANAYANQVHWSILNTGNFTNTYIKDIYIMADTGTGPYTTYLGDITVVVEYPNVAGTNQQYTPNTGTQVAAVQDGINHTGTWPDGDTTYISDNTVGHISDFAHQTLSLTGQIYEVCHVSYMRKDDAGTREVAQVTVEGGVVVETGTTISLGNTYQYYFDGMSKDPGTSAQWTVANYNAATFGVETIL